MRFISAWLVFGLGVFGVFVADHALPFSPVYQFSNALVIWAEEIQGPGPGPHDLNPSFM